LAIEKLRVVALKPEASPASPWRSPGFEFPPRRRRKRLLDQPPMFWKEVHGDALLGSARLGAFILYFQMVAGWCLVPSLCVGMLGTRDPNATIRMASTVFSAVMLLTVAASAAGTVSGERERGTLETLLSMPLEREDILYAKCLGAILSVRLIWWCLGAIWLVGFLFLGLNLCAVPLLVLAWWSHAAVFACLGLCFSLVCSTSLRATLWTLVTVFVLAIGLRLMGTYGEVLLTGWMPRDLARFVVLLCRDGLAPFASLDALALGWNAFDSHHAQLELMKTAMVGVMYYFAAAWLLWLLARWLFSRVATNVNYV